MEVTVIKCCSTDISKISGLLVPVYSIFEHNFDLCKGILPAKIYLFLEERLFHFTMETVICNIIVSCCNINLTQNTICVV